MSEAKATKVPDGLINTEHGLKYWQNAEASTDGLLGGIQAMKNFSHVSRTDILGSRTFLARLGIGLKGGRVPVKLAMEGGAG